LVELAELFGAELDPAALDVTVTGVSLSDAAVRPGDLFAALPGARLHGARFVPAAAAAGAVALLTDAGGLSAARDAGLPAIVVDDPRALVGPASALVYDEPTEKLTVIGITGTAGKTTTTYLIEAGLRAAGLSTGLIGTVETRVGDLVVKSERTTPEACDLQGLFGVGVEQGVDAIAMEVSSHALALGRADGIRYAVGGYTNFGSDHLDFHRTAEEYFAAKALLFDGRAAAEVLNFDDPALVPLRRPATVTYSAAGDPAATWRAGSIEPTGFGQRFLAYGPDGAKVDAAVTLPGRHNVANALLALASLVAIGIDPQIAAIGVAACPGVPGRLELVAAPGPVTGVVDYAHKPDSVVAALASLRADRDGRLICVIGAGGDRDRAKRPVMGAAAARGADLVIVTDDNPRTEDPAAIRADVRAGAESAGTAAEIIEVDGRRDAIAEAVRLARPGDVIAVLGKGHEQGQEIDGVVSPFDDRVELASALAARFDPPASPATAPTSERTTQ
jgi:UDP-N-acetylmuramoyl-L-alanyl-D-glutamate--2,6-diaminopimelate ligase